MYAEVINEFTVYSQLSGDRNSADFASAMRQGYRSAGWRGALSKALETRLARRKSGYVSPYEIATLYANLGDKQGAFKWLDVAYQDRDIGLMRLKTDFLLDSLRSDSRFSELMTKVGLLQ